MLPGLQRLAAIAAEPATDPQAVLARLAGLYADVLRARDGFASAYVPDRPDGWGVDRDRTAELAGLREQLKDLLRPYLAAR
jgi:hypothetical protein